MGKAKGIRAAVEDELTFDPLVDSSGIRVEGAGRSVALRGTVASYPQYLGASAATRRVAGVTIVHDYLEVVLPPEDERDDALLTTAANNALELNSTVPGGVEATAHGGRITLTGTVRFGYQRTAAEMVVATLTGVRKVADDIEISWDADPVDVTAAVRDALHRHALISDGSDVVVITDGNTVTVAGHVRTWAERDAVVDAAWMTPTVYDVYDELVVTG
jgi:osmotically-inducible protein OsmY